MKRIQTFFCLLVLLSTWFLPVHAAAESIRCESRNGESRQCGSDIISARLVQLLSDWPCDHGQTWGVSSGHLWVSSYCRGVFSIQKRGNPTYRRLSVSHTGPGPGSIVSSPAGIDYPARAEASFLLGTAVSIYPTSDAGSVFTGWSGDCSGKGDCTVLLTENSSVTAHFNKVSLVPIHKLLLKGGGVSRRPPTNIPSVTITYPTSNPSYSTSNSTLSLGGSALDDGRISKVSWSNDRGGSGTCSGTSSWDTDDITLASGLNRLTVTAWDTVGNSATDTLTVNYDPTSPAIAITSPTDSTTYHTTSGLVSIGGSASDNDGISQVRWSNDRGSNGTCSGTTSWNTGNIALVSGPNIITITALDTVGNYSTDALIVIYDTEVPMVSINSPSSAANFFTGSNLLSIGGTADDNVGVSEVRWSNNRGGSGTCSGTTDWSASGIVLGEGDNVITVTARDGAGNSATDTLTVNYSPGSPTVSITSPTPNPTFFTDNSSLSISGTAVDIGVGSVVRWSNNRGGSGTCSGTSSWSASGITLYSGTNEITVMAVDGAGNTSTTDTLTVIYDLIDPTISIISPTSATTYLTRFNLLSISGMSGDNVGIREVRWSNNRGGSGTCSGTSSWSASGIRLSSGENVIRVTAYDLAGNTRTDTLEVTYDPTAPAVSITSPTSSSTFYTRRYNPLTIGGTAYDTYGLSQVRWSNSRGGSGTCSGTSSWSASGIKLSSGINVITVTAYDLAGNTRSDSLTVIYDTVSPTITITSPTSSAEYTTPYSPQTISGSAYDGYGLSQVRWSNSRGGSGSCSGTTSWTCSGLELYGGDNTVTITAYDLAGNTGTDVVYVTYRVSAPLLLTPANNTGIDYDFLNKCLDENVTWLYRHDVKRGFYWSSVYGATQYQIYVLGPSGQTPSPFILTTVTSNSYVYTLTAQISNSLTDGWRWWVRAGNSNGLWSGWSGPWYFNVGICIY